MFNDETSVASILLSDPEDIPAFASPRSSNRPASERRILVGDDLRAQVVVDTEKLNTYLDDHVESDPYPFDRIWRYVRSGEEEALREFPFLLTAGRLRHLVSSGKITLEPAVSDLPRLEPGKWLTAQKSRKPSKMLSLWPTGSARFSTCHVPYLSIKISPRLVRNGM